MMRKRPRATRPQKSDNKVTFWKESTSNIFLLAWPYFFQRSIFSARSPIFEVERDVFSFGGNNSVQFSLSTSIGPPQDSAL
jgi:hypothetical protein